MEGYSMVAFRINHKSILISWNHFVNSTVMMKRISTYLIFPTGFLLALCFTASLFWCGDAECLTGAGNEDCTSLICSLLDKHDASSTQNSLGGSSKDCSCVCHVPTVAAEPHGVSYVPTAQYYVSVVTSNIPSSLERLVYHPPIAS